MVPSKSLLPFVFCLLVARAATAQVVALEWVIVGDQGNAGDPQPTCTQCGPSTTFGAVSYPYAISKFEVTNAQYAVFLNAVAAADPNTLYSEEMGLEEPPFPFYGGILRSGAPGSYSYTVVAGREDKPVNYVGWYDAIRFANWLDNGQPTGAQGPTTTEDGAYTITFAGILNNNIARNPGAEFFVPSEDEWYKAAYYDAATVSYFDYPTRSNVSPVCAAPNADANQANCDGPGANDFDADVDNLTNVGAFAGSPSPYGTFDQGGNVWEWNERILSSGSTRGVRGGSFAFLSSYTAASVRDACAPNCDVVNYGIRIAATVPEAGWVAMLGAGVAGLAGVSRRRLRAPRT